MMCFFFWASHFWSFYIFAKVRVSNSHIRLHRTGQGQALLCECWSFDKTLVSCPHKNYQHLLPGDSHNCLHYTSKQSATRLHPRWQQYSLSVIVSVWAWKKHWNWRSTRATEGQEKQSSLSKCQGHAQNIKILNWVTGRPHPSLSASGQFLRAGARQQYVSPPTYQYPRRLCSQCTWLQYWENCWPSNGRNCTPLLPVQKLTILRNIT